MEPAKYGKEPEGTLRISKAKAMLKAWQIGKFFGIGVYLHWSFLLLPLLVVLTAGDSNREQLGTIGLLAVVLCLMVCVVLHEFGHALTARLFGIGTRDITLYPIGGVARLERMSEKPAEEFWIAVAGPAVNVVIAILLAWIAVPLMGLAPDWVLDESTGQPGFVGWLIGLNIGLVIFNMVPAFPMDGGRVFRSLLSMVMGHLNATRIAAWVGAVFAMLGIALAIYSSHFMLALIGVFVFFAGQQELRYVEWRHGRAQPGEDDEEPIPAIPVRRPYYTMEAPTYAPEPRGMAPASGFLFQPRVSVYVWDNETGAWIRESRAAPELPS